MKAWDVTDRNCDTGINYIVFAETRGKAISKALHHSDGTFDWYTFTELWAKRRPQFDEYHHGRDFMDWCNDDDRVAMVRLGGFRCSDDCCMSYAECLECPAHEWCGEFEEMEKETEEEEASRDDA